MKSRNPLILYPHGAARKSTCETARICYEAAIKAGAPENCIQWIPKITRDQVLHFMSHKRIALVLATGSVKSCKCCVSLREPCHWCWSWKCFRFILVKVQMFLLQLNRFCSRKLFDNGTICASEQAVVVSKYNAQQVREEFLRNGAYFLSPEEAVKVGEISFNVAQRSMRPEVIGQSAENHSKDGRDHGAIIRNIVNRPMRKDQVGSGGLCHWKFWRQSRIL